MRNADISISDDDRLATLSSMADLIRRARQEAPMDTIRDRFTARILRRVEFNTIMRASRTSTRKGDHNRAAYLLIEATDTLMDGGLRFGLFSPGKRGRSLLRRAQRSAALAHEESGDIRAYDRLRAEIDKKAKHLPGM